MKMHKPPHPGEILNTMYIQPLEMNVSETAKALGISRQTLSELVNGRRGISTEMAMRLAKAFDTTPQYWLNLQNQSDLWKIRNRKFNDVDRIVA